MYKSAADYLCAFTRAVRSCALGIATHLRVVLGAQLDELREDKRGWPRSLLQRQARANFVGRFSF
jgi:hypothetical protein